MGTAVVNPSADTTTDPNETTSTDKPESAHIVAVPPHVKALHPTLSPQDFVTISIIEGAAITALCGFTWVPHKNPKNLPVCQECKDIYESDPRGHGDRDRLPDA